MSWAGVDGRPMNRVQLQAHIDALPVATWASGMTLHNTAAPTMTQWAGPTSREQRIRNLEGFFRDVQRWPSAPHAFVDWEYVWLFTPFKSKGTHSPSWNGTRFGIEMCGDFSRGVDDPTTGRGLETVKNTAALFAMLHTKYGWNPDTIKLHKEDPRTTHDCPGNLIVKGKFISMVQEYMGHGGDMPHVIPDEPTKKAGVAGRVTGVADDDTLNVRESSSASSRIVATLKNGTALTVLSHALNGSTQWVFISTDGGVSGWVNARYVKL